MITLNAIAKRLEEFATNHFFIKSYSFGSPDDVDLDKFQDFPLMHSVYTGSDYDERTKTFSFELYVFDRPNREEQMTLNQREVVSDAQMCLEDVIADIANGGNIFFFDEDYEVTGATITPLVDERSNLLTGALLDLTIQVPYQRDACNLPINGVSPEGGEIAYQRRGILRVRTQDGSVDVLSVNEIRVTNGTLTDEGGGVVSLSITGGGGGGAVDSVNGQTGVVVLDSDDIAEGATNLYFTNARVDARVTALELATETYVDTQVGNEESARITADSGLQSQITTNAGDIATNAGDIATNASGIAANAAAIVSNDGDISSLDGRLTTAESDIAALEAITHVNSLNGITGAVTLSAGSNVTLTQVGNDIEIASSGGGGGGSDSFNTIAVPGQASIVADSGNDTLNIHAGTGIELTTNAGTDTLTIAVDATTTDIAEGTNLYFTNTRADARIAAASVTDLSDVTSAGSGAIITSAERTKLNGIEAGAEVNPTAGEIKTAYESNANTNAYTDAEQTKLAGIAAGAEVNVNADWNAASGDAQILNKPTLAAVATSGAYSDLSGTPSLAAVATSGAYADLSGTPTIPDQFFEVKSTAATSYTLDATDAGRYLVFTASSAVTITIPFNTFQVDTEIVIEQGGTGQVEVTPAGSVTLNTSAANTKKTAERYAVIALKCTANNVWTLTGERELA